jgi:hypothetical protein
MPRPKKTKVKLDSNSLLHLMQEIYNDCMYVTERARKELNERKVRATITDTNDEYQIGKVNNETLKIIENTIDKKLSLAKLQTQVLNDHRNGNPASNPKTISEDDKNTLRELLKERKLKNNNEYDVD